MTGVEFLEKVQIKTHTEPYHITDVDKDVFLLFYDRDFGNANRNDIIRSYVHEVERLKSFTLPTVYESEAIYPFLYEQLCAVFHEGKKWMFYAPI